MSLCFKRTSFILTVNLSFPHGDWIFFVWQVPRDYPRDGYLVTFELRPEVPLETILQLADAVQGLCTFQGCELQGETIYPDTYMVCSGSSYNLTFPQPGILVCLLFAVLEAM